MFAPETRLLSLKCHFALELLQFCIIVSGRAQAHELQLGRCVAGIDCRLRPPTIARIAGPCRCRATLYGLCTSDVRVGQAGKGTLFREELAASYLGDAARPHSCKRRVCKNLSASIAQKYLASKAVIVQPGSPNRRGIILNCVVAGRG